jgi:hypothetical protein
LLQDRAKEERVIMRMNEREREREREVVKKVQIKKQLELDSFSKKIVTISIFSSLCNDFSK